jgi:multiple sugar transport system ATP-binding protein
VTETAVRLGLETVLGRLPAELSGGQQQRTTLGRALVRRPAVYLFDEPLSHLDPPLRAELRRELDLLHRQLRATMIYVTHDQHEALSLGDRVAVLNNGRLQQVCPPSELIDRPYNRFVAGFIGWPPMNFLDGRLEGAGAGTRFVSEDGSCSLPADPAHHYQTGQRGPATVGIRPSDIRVNAGDSRNRTTLRMQVVGVEALGGETLVTYGRSGWQVVGKENGRPGVRPGEAVEVCFDMTRTHWFDRMSGAALWAAGPEG